MKNQFAVLRSKGVKLAVASSAMVASAASFAIDTTAISDAQADGVSAVTLVVGGLIGIVAIVVGVNIVISMLKKA
jgi:hypothetical protein